MNKGNILIIDDEENIRNMLSEILVDESYTAFTAGEWDEGKKVLLSSKVDIVLLDIWLPKVGGMDILEILNRDFIGVEVIMISGHGNIDLAVKAIKKGAFDFLEKPLSIERILTVVENGMRIKRLQEENQSLKASIGKEYEMIGNSQAINDIKNKISAAAVSNARVLITGENGSGKELVARAIHFQSSRSNKPFIEINCAAIPENLIESELFGHEKGSFTGAIAQKKGKFELANTGTIFLDEVADMSLATQAKVLRVLEEMKFQRIGGSELLSTDVRVIAATNKDIKKMIQDGTFREDLYYRLNVIPILNPSLKDRKEDIPLLVEYFLLKFSRDAGLEKKKIDNEAIKLIQENNWPGNIRQLRNFIERLNVLVPGEIITQEMVIEHLAAEGTTGQTAAVKSYSKILKAEDYDTEITLKDAKDKFEMQFIIRRLEENSFNISATAKTLDIERSNLHKKIKQYGIDVER